MNFQLLRQNKHLLIPLSVNLWKCYCVQFPPKRWRDANTDSKPDSGPRSCTCLHVCVLSASDGFRRLRPELLLCSFAGKDFPLDLLLSLQLHSIQLPRLEGRKRLSKFRRGLLGSCKHGGVLCTLHPAPLKRTFCLIAVS